MSLRTDFRKLLSLWLNWMLRSPVVVIIIMGLLTFFALQFTANNLSINTDTAELIAPDAPFQQNRRNFEKAFSQDMHTLLLVVESDTPELTKSATRRLGRLLSTDKKNIQSVYIPNDNVFFHQNGLLYLDAEDLQTIAGNLSQAQPFIGRITQEPNLTGFFSIFEDALTSTDKNQDLPIDLPALIDKVSLVLHKAINGSNGLLSWQELIAEKKLKTAQSTKGFIIILPKFDYTQIRPAELAINSIRQAVAQIQDANLPNVKVWVTGEVGLEDDELSGMSAGTFTASIFSIVLVCVILLIAYRSIVFTVATLLTLAVGMVFCGAFAAFSVKELNLISVAFAVSNIGLGVEYAIHFCLRYRDNLNHHIDRGRAIRSTLVSTGPSLMLCAGTTAIGLYAFIPTDYKGVSELGLLAGTSLFICLAVTLIVLPALLKIIPMSMPAQSTANKAIVATLAEKIATSTLHYAKPIVFVTATLAVISIALVFKVQTDFNPINLRDPNTESVIAFKSLTKDKETTPMTLTILAKDEAKAKALQQKLATVASVDKTISLFDFIPSDQEDKLLTIEDMALTLGTTLFPALKPDLDPIPGIQHLIKAIDTVLPTKTDAHEIQSLTVFKKELQDMLIELETRQEPSRRDFIEKVQTALLGTLPNVMNDLFTSFKANEVTMKDLPLDIKDRWLSKEGWYRIQIFPKKDLNNLADLQEFITDVQAIAPETTDLPIMYWESMKEVIAAFQQAIVIALVTIALLLYVIRRNVIDTLLVMTPLLLAGLLTMASTVITHTPINFANIIALPLLLGLGVDNGIHMVEKLHHSLSDEQNIYQSSTARAMFYGALTTASSFAGLAFSPHQGIASMGLIITMGIFWIMVCTFIVLPALSKVVLKNKVSAQAVYEK
ncbi:Hopanoid biosynthesis associated RND transporter like protein HpnN [Crenothrix polyspora]|uniref:Hopanoid biosynthesis associated RND transporter like protein HpnN n=1 Tax=Crenothrix polyspora TaxID=360316 RepID=A0A1R4HIA0_9GAMM|nr:MMPL family transporter [Crenothrix polyspora]SJM95962.1 Hopanoid biosynthesis associated RND transporter like protein HpnN [Crenothrix polyspora]